MSEDVAAARLEDYRPPAFLIDHARLRFELDVPVTRVTARLRFRAAVGQARQPLVLDGDGISLVDLRLDGTPVAPGDYQLTEKQLVLPDVPVTGELMLVMDVEPERDMAGLVWLNGTFATNCEPEGFRKICFFPDRPDILTRFECELVADPVLYPRLLANGHLKEEGVLPDGRHFARWEDPFPKACYLVAVVAGKLEHIEDRFVMRSGRSITLSVHAPAEDLPFCREGLISLKKAMDWDETWFGREYDLDVLNVAVLRSYPGGAMEKKGLNIYATEFFLSSPEISTDAQIFRVLATVGHEYFHNWSGNRVGCRDWFQLALKEGLTVYRQQEFMRAMAGATEARIDDVMRLREIQYREDDGKLAHAIRPATYVTPNNLYTRTVYDKGAEVIRMLELIVGPESLRGAISAFFDAYDGQATTIESFLQTVERESGADLEQFRNWYRVAGAVEVVAEDAYDARSGAYVLTLEQKAGGPPLQIPIRLAFYGATGALLPLAGRGEPRSNDGERVLMLREARQTFHFENVAERPVLSLFRGYSAPVRCSAPADVASIALLARHDSDPVNRWDSAQRLAALAILPGDMRDEARRRWFALFEEVLNGVVDPGLAGHLLRLPSERQLGRDQVIVDVDGLAEARNALASKTAALLRKRLREVHDALGTLAADPARSSERRLRNLCLFYLMCCPEEEDLERSWHQFRQSETMEDAGSALALLIDQGGDYRAAALAEAQERWQPVAAKMDRWFAIQANSGCEDTALRVQALTRHPMFHLDNATRVKAVFDTFTANQRIFHEANGRGYEVVASAIRELDERNPRLAARFLKPFAEWCRMPPDRGRRMLVVCENLLAEQPSQDVAELANTILAGAGHEA